MTARARAASVGRSARAGLLKVLDDACSETVWRGPWRQGGWLPPVGRAGGRFLESVGVDPSLLAGEALTLIEEDLATWRALPNAELRALVESLVGLARPVGAGNPRANDELRRIAAATPALSLRERGRDLLVKLARVPAVHDALTETMVNGEGVQERQLCLEVLSTAGFGTPGQVARAVDILFEIALERPASPERLAGFVTDTRRRRALLREVQARQQTRRQEAVSTLAVLADLAESGSTDDERAIGEAVLQRIHQVFQSHYQGWGGEREESFFTALSRLGGGGGAPHKAAAFAMSPVEAAQFSSAQQRLAETFGGWLHRQLQEVRQELIEVKSDPTATDRADALESQVGELQTAIGELETGGK